MFWRLYCKIQMRHWCFIYFLIFAPTLLRQMVLLHFEVRGIVSCFFVLLTQKAASGWCGLCWFWFKTCVSSTTPQDSQKSTTTKLINLPEHLEQESTRSCKNGCLLTSSRTRSENALANHCVDRVFMPNTAIVLNSFGMLSFHAIFAVEEAVVGESIQQAPHQIQILVA